uniref:Uncharacterized protein n=1 Tax=Tanacetum cinerariifolium TaxID=118510 RepID=A0A699KJY2_TANCI|nr:hypothetical protein [Tanacetum cinerariifolium]
MLLKSASTSFKLTVVDVSPNKSPNLFLNDIALPKDSGSRKLDPPLEMILETLEVTEGTYRLSVGTVSMLLKSASTSFKLTVVDVSPNKSPNLFSNDIALPKDSGSRKLDPPLEIILETLEVTEGTYRLSVGTELLSGIASSFLQPHLKLPFVPHGTHLEEQ